MARTTTRDFAVGLAAIAVGLNAALLAATIENTTGTPVGPGAFPMVVGICIGLAGAFVVVTALRARAHPGEADSTDAGPAPARPRWKPLVLPVGVGAFCVVAVTFSLTVSTAAMFVLCGRYMARYRWLTSVAIGLVGAVVVHVAFRVLLEVPLPADMVL